MATTPHIGAAELPCPHCGYDLRATATTGGSRRCPECGTYTRVAGEGGLTASKIPWLHRRRRGRIRSFFATMWMALITPWRLAAQTTTPARFRDARRFRIIILVLTTLMASAFIAYAVRNWDLNRWDPRFNYEPLIPASLLADRWYGMISLLASVYAANLVRLKVYEWIIPMGARPYYLKRRMRALTCYSSSFLLIETITAILALSSFNEWLKVDRRHPHDKTMMALTLITGGIGMASYLFASLPLALRTGRPRLRALRAFLIVLYPALTLELYFVIVIAINWAVGYIILGIRSMS